MQRGASAYNNSYADEDDVSRKFLQSTENKNNDDEIGGIVCEPDFDSITDQSKLEEESLAYDDLYQENRIEDWCEEKDLEDDQEPLEEPHSYKDCDQMDHLSAKTAENKSQTSRNISNWKREVIENDGNPINMIEKVMERLVLFNQEKANLMKATKFVIAWFPKSVPEVINWLEEIIQKIIVVAAETSVDKDGMMIITGMMIRRNDTMILNHIQLQNRGRYILIKMRTSKNNIKKQRETFFFFRKFSK